MVKSLLFIYELVPESEPAPAQKIPGAGQKRTASATLNITGNTSTGTYLPMFPVEY